MRVPLLPIRVGELFGATPFPGVAAPAVAQSFRWAAARYPPPAPGGKAIESRPGITDTGGRAPGIAGPGAIGYPRPGPAPDAGLGEIPGRGVEKDRPPMKILLRVAAGLGPILAAPAAPGDEPRPASTIRLSGPDRQLTAALALFGGRRAPHPAAALAAWKRGTPGPTAWASRRKP